MEHLIITGPGRSGTTALQALLNTSDKFFISNESAWYHSLSVDCSERMNIIMKDSTNSQLLKDREIDIDKYLEVVNRTKMTGLECIKYFEHASKARFVGDKYPLYVLDMEDVRKSVPGVKFLVTVRNPKAIVSSLFRKFESESKGLSPVSSWATNDMQKAERYVLTFYSALLIQMSKEHTDTKIVRYESSCSDVRSLEKGLSEFLNEDVHLREEECGYAPTNIEVLDIAYTPKVLNLCEMLGY